MARKRIYSRPGLFGTVSYYDGQGNYIGKSRPGLLEGTRVFSDRNGRYAGTSRPGFLAKEVFSDTDRNRITTYGGFLGDVHFKNGVPIGSSHPGIFSSSCTTLETEEMEEVWEEMPETPAAPPANPIHSVLTFALCLGLFGLIVGIFAIISANS